LISSEWADDNWFNPLPSLTLQSARDLNVPCRHKRSKALLLTPKKQDFL
jgi:hypothetical protein